VRRSPRRWFAMSNAAWLASASRCSLGSRGPLSQGGQEGRKALRILQEEGQGVQDRSSGCAFKSALTVSWRLCWSSSRSSGKKRHRGLKNLGPDVWTAGADYRLGQVQPICVYAFFSPSAASRKPGARW
jgi:hypothetical protein